MARIHILALLFAALICLAAASSPPTFCKCTCFKNSTIIPLGPEHQSKRSLPFFDTIETPATEAPAVAPRSASTSCSECTKAFCLKQGIPFCKDATEDDVFTMCFQRDSNKDKIIVWGFILGTVGLLGWAAFKRFSEWRVSRRFGRQDIAYAPVAPGQ
ncbi:MFS transporter, putative [Cordyceps militaris]|uniref:MFS transporter, putative n=1 Tax=Cordyceps militaris TaxID=73501 RepID=A0A2H4S9A2_CORMI|nr:MFS transporter, putative [Cordyceps militaris]